MDDSSFCYCPWVGLIACFILFYQALSYQANSPYTAVLIIIWITFGLISYLVVRQQLLSLAVVQFSLIGLGFWRFLGHTVEPMPPGILNEKFNKKYAMTYKLIPPFLLGFISEFSAGLPFRLFPIWVYYAMDRWNKNDTNDIVSCTEAKKTVAMIHKYGWGAHPITRQKLHDVLPSIP